MHRKPAFGSGKKEKLSYKVGLSTTHNKIKQKSLAKVTLTLPDSEAKI